MILTKEQIQKIISEYFAGKPVKKVWLFGSYARGDADENSDLDVLVEVDYANNPGLSFFGWHAELSQKTDKSVDVVSDGGLSKYIRPYVEKDKLLMYEK
ncbi:MAG: nucleotidyltransferase [Sediminibacterium sp.]|nr:nucleotidyltransferase [Sediminibacterium sp.]